MNYLPQLTENEVCYICSVIPLQDSIYYFQRNPKEFAKIMPGFRAASMKNQAQVSALLFRCRNQYFISSFIEKQISNWLSQIQEHIAKMMEDGDSKELALLHTGPVTLFRRCIKFLYLLIPLVHPYIFREKTKLWRDLAFPLLPIYQKRQCQRDGLVSKVWSGR